MQTQLFDPLRWTTSSHADATHSQPMEIDALGAHLGHCIGAREPWFLIGCLGEAVHNFVAPRIVTTLSMALVVIAASTWLI